MELDAREVVVEMTDRLRPGLEEAAANQARVVAEQVLDTEVPRLVREYTYASTRPRHVWRVGKWQIEWTLRRNL